MKKTRTYIRNDLAKAIFLKKSTLKIVLMLSTLIAFGFNEAFAKHDWTVGTHTNVSYDVSTALVKIEIMYFDGNGSDIVDYNAGFAGYLNLTFGSEKVYIHCDDEGHNLEVLNGEKDNLIPGPHPNWTFNPTTDLWNDGDDSDTNNRWLNIYWKIPQTALNINQTITLNGKWWNRGATADETIENVQITILPSYSIRDITVSTPEFTTSNNKPAIKIHWAKSGTTTLNADNFGNINLRESSSTGTVKKTVSASGKTSGDFYLYPDSSQININQTNTYVVTQEYTPSTNTNVKYQTVSGNATVPGFQQVTPGSFEAILDASTRKINLNWNVPSGSGTEFRTDNFTISGSTNATVAYDRTKSNYTYSITVPEGTTATYTYYINRLSAWYNYYYQSASVSVNLNHCKPTNAAVTLAADQRSAVITWSKTGSIWSTGSRFVITRQNLTLGSSEAINLTQTEFNSGTYTDAMVQICNKYRYKLQVIPSDSWAPIPEIFTSEVTPTEIGQLSVLTASKGYFSDKIELNWKTSNGSFDKFTINRKEYQQPDSLYRQIMSVDGSPVLSTYKVEDVSAVPGVIYRYQIIGLVNCANVIVASQNKPTDIGFRTPTGDIYGRVTFSDGQAVKGVEVRLESEEVISGKNYRFSGTGSLSITNTALLSTNTDTVCIQAWIRPTDLTNRGNILQKTNMYEMYTQSDRLYFKAGSQTVSSDSLISAIKGSEAFVHVTAISTRDSLYLYMNGKLVKRILKTATVTGNNNQVIIGNLFKGNIDELRIWSRALTEEEIKIDYKRYLVGNEKGLVGYYTFDYAVNDKFFDTSYKKNTYNENHGTAQNVILDEVNVPTNDQLGYKGMTGADGAYTIRAIPYTGNGIAYIIIPRLGTHKFESEREIRFIGPNAQSHTVNFVDKSSFSVSGTVTYKGGTIPVEGVMFTIDGKTAMMGNGSIIQTNAEGKFTISVPVGTHEVKAVKNNHIFEMDGKITNSNGTDRNYQDDVYGIELTDITTIRYIGRVAGGTIQEEKPMGHSLSKNNLADGIKVTLRYENISYKIVNKDTTLTVSHFKPSNKNTANTNTVDYTAESIIIYPNVVTGEFVADVIPENFALSVNIPGHNADNIPGNNARLNLKNSFSRESSINTYPDSALVNGKWTYTNYSDTVFFNKQQKFILRYPPQISVTQLNNGVTPVEWFGDDTISVNTMDPINSYSLTMYDNSTKTYLIGMPVFEQAKTYSFRTKVFEKYVYKDSDGEVKTDILPDEVPTQDAKITFGDGLTGKVNEQLTVDDNGMTVFTFQAGNPELTSAVRT